MLEEQSIAEEPTPVAEQSLLTSDSEDDIMVLDDTNLDDSNDADVQPVPVQKDESLDIIADMLQNAAPLTNLPNVGETLIFKLSKSRGQHQTKRSNPSLTDYIAGTCSYVNRRTKLITIHIIACARGINHILRQYANNYDGSYDSIPILNVNLKELTDAKVIVSEVD
ncbi:GH19986 [Drosophila grimshawi]|uniref:GH19986 n=2 Tax=Drosophila grimshawi TaxID=7222 RepID=B4J8B6_DROGR|nr:GH19986 [Drosophila grimshawi]